LWLFVCPVTPTDAGIASPLTRPAEYPQDGQVHQQIGGVADIPIRGFYDAASFPSAAIEAQWGGGAWTVIDATPDAGVFEGRLSGMPVGWNRLVVRIQGGPVLYDIPDVGVGDVFVIAGQSNAVMLTQTLRTSVHKSSTLSLVPPPGRLFTHTADPLHDPAQNWGSVWPLLADAISASTGVPVMFVATAEPATGLVTPPEWQGFYWNRMIQNVSVATSGQMCVRAVLWHQGERDALMGVSTSAYRAALESFAERLQRYMSCRTPVVSAVIGPFAALSAERLEAIRRAQRDAALSSSVILPGPETADLPTIDGLHFGDAAVPDLLERWCSSLASFYTGLACPMPPCTEAPRAIGVTISGHPEMGQVLTGRYRYCDAEGMVEGSSTFRWLRDGVAVRDSGTIGDPPGTDNYIPDGADLYHTLTFEVTPVRADGTLGEPGRSAPIVIAAPNVAPTAEDVEIHGIPEGAQTLFASYTYTDADGDPEGASRFQWKRNSVDIPGATSSTHVVTFDDRGQTLTVEVTPVAAERVSPGIPVLSPRGVVVGPVGEPNLVAGAAVSLMVGQRVDAVLDSSVSARWFRYGVRAGRSYCVEVVPAPSEQNGSANPVASVYRGDGTTLVSTNDSAVTEPAGLVNARTCYIPSATEANLLVVTQNTGTPVSYAVRVLETTLYSNWFFVGGDYRAYTQIRNTTDGPVSYSVTWRNMAGAVVATASGILAATSNASIDAKVFPGAAAAVSGSVEIAHTGSPDAIVAHTTVISAAAGLSFDTLLSRRALAAFP
jgi:hypothetical protein